MIPFFRKIRNLSAGKAGKMADDVSCPFFMLKKKNEKKEPSFTRCFLGLSIEYLKID